MGRMWPKLVDPETGKLWLIGMLWSMILGTLSLAEGQVHGGVAPG